MLHHLLKVGSNSAFSKFPAKPVGIQIGPTHQDRASASLQHSKPFGSWHPERPYGTATHQTFTSVA